MNRFKLRIKCPGGLIETVVNDPKEKRRGIALIAHPHPLHGGTLDNKVVLTIAQAAYERGYVAVRPNFRGVGQSEGDYDHGHGEVDDLVEIARFVAGHYPGIPTVLAGVSFGAYVQAQVAAHIESSRVILIAPALTLFSFDTAPPGARIIHGEVDALVPASTVARWATERDVPMTVIPGADHFFHGRLADLKQAVLDACSC